MWNRPNDSCLCDEFESISRQQWRMAFVKYAVNVCAFCENLFISNLQLLTKLMLQKTLLTLQKSRKLLFVLSASEKLF